MRTQRKYWHNYCAAAGLCLLLSACGGGGATRVSQAPAVDSASLSALLPALASLPARGSSALPSEVPGGSFMAEMPHAAVDIPFGAASAAVYTPGTQLQGLSGAAYAIYELGSDNNSLPLLDISWEVAPDSGSVWVALADWNAKRWHWFEVQDASQSLGLGSLSPYVDAQQRVAVAVVAGPGTASTLAKLSIPGLVNDYLPDGPRPRLWLTQERLDGLKAAASANTPEWQRFSNESQMYLTDEFWGDLINFTIPFTLLMYKVTGESKWADRSMDLMDQSPLDEWQISCCPYHNQIHNIALGYDWLYDYPGMTETKKQQYRDKMLHLADNLWVDALNSDGVSNSQDTDRVTMSGASLLTIGCALWGDDPRAPEIYERGWRMWTKGLGTPPANGIYRQWTDAQPVRRWIQDFGDGPWPSGWFYATGTDMVGLTDYFTTLQTACGYDPNVLEPGMSDTWKNQIRCFIYGMDPKRTTTYSGADWQESDLFENYNNAYIHSCLAAIADQAERAGDTQEASWARWLVRNINGAHSNTFREFLFSPGASPTVANPFNAGLPLVAYSAGGSNYMYFRDGWDTEARWGIFGGQAGVPCDHPQMDQGHFSLIRGGEYLTRDAPGYKEFGIGAQTYNTLNLDNSNGGYPHNSNFDTPAKMTRRLASQADPLMAYGMMDMAGQYNEDPNWWESDQRIQVDQRHFVWAGDYAVVFDRVRRTDVSWAHYRLRSMVEPTVSGDTVSQSSADGSQKLLQRTLEPAGCEFSVHDETELFGSVENWQIDSSYRHWQTVIQPANTDSLDMLNVIRMGDSSLSGFDANLQHISDANNAGVVIGPWCVVFGRGTTLRTNVAYTVTSAQAGGWHLICDLEPGQYTLTVSGEGSRQVNVDAAGDCVLFQTSSGGSLTVVLSKL